MEYKATDPTGNMVGGKVKTLLHTVAQLGTEPVAFMLLVPHKQTELTCYNLN